MENNTYEFRVELNGSLQATHTVEIGDDGCIIVKTDVDGHYLYIYPEQLNWYGYLIELAKLEKRTKEKYEKNKKESEDFEF